MASFNRGETPKIENLPSTPEALLKTDLPLLTANQLQVFASYNANPTVKLELTTGMPEGVTLDSQELIDFDNHASLVATAPNQNLDVINYKDFLYSNPTSLSLLSNEIRTRSNVIGLASVAGALLAKNKYNTDTLTTKNDFESAKTGLETAKTQLEAARTEEQTKLHFFNVARGAYTSADTQYTDAYNEYTTASAARLAKDTAFKNAQATLTAAKVAFDKQLAISEKARKIEVRNKIVDLDNLKAELSNLLNMLGHQRTVVERSVTTFGRKVPRNIDMANILSQAAEITDIDQFFKTSDVEKLAIEIGKMIKNIDELKMIVYVSADLPVPVVNELAERRRGDREESDTALVNPIEVEPSFENSTPEQVLMEFDEAIYGTRINSRNNRNNPPRSSRPRVQRGTAA